MQKCYTVPDHVGTQERTTCGEFGVQLPALVAMIGVFMLGGCAKYYWAKPGSTRDQFDADSRECAKQATASPAAARASSKRCTAPAFRRAVMHARSSW